LFQALIQKVYWFVEGLKHLDCYFVKTVELPLSENSWCVLYHIQYRCFETVLNQCILTDQCFVFLNDNDYIAPLTLQPSWPSISLLHWFCLCCRHKYYYILIIFIFLLQFLSDLWLIPTFDIWVFIFNARPC
jgi:hypothetical protein